MAPAIVERWRRLLPFPLRLELVRLKRLPAWIVEAPAVARRRAGAEEAAGYRHVLAAHRSPLERQQGAIDPALQHGKECNVRLAAQRLDRLVVEPAGTFSYHHAVGRPSRVRGFRKGLELRDGEPSGEVGGGLCQVSNSFYWVALQAGMRIVERHRHGLDLFPDHERTVPFGCGATVVYTYADLRFANPFDQAVMLGARIDNGRFLSEIRSEADPGWKVEVEEVGHRFYRDDGGWVRENRLRRRIIDAGGAVRLDEEAAHNVGRVMYDPEGTALPTT